MFPRQRAHALAAFFVSLLQRTGCWGFQKFPVICGLKTTRFDGMKLLQGRPEGTFLLRLSSRPGALVVMYVKPMQEASPNKKLHDSAFDVNIVHLIVRESASRFFVPVLTNQSSGSFTVRAASNSCFVRRLLFYLYRSLCSSETFLSRHRLLQASTTSSRSSTGARR